MFIIYQIKNKYGGPYLGGHNSNELERNHYFYINQNVYASVIEMLTKKMFKILIKIL